MAETDPIAALATSYAAATQEFLDAVAAMTPAQLDASDGEGWTPRQVIHHMADSEAQSYVRLRRLVAEPDPVIQGYDEAAWATAPLLGYTELPIEHSLAVFTAVRASSLDIIRRLTSADLDRSGTHSESGPCSLRQWVEIYAGHPRDHADQLRRAIAASS